MKCFLWIFIFLNLSVNGYASLPNTEQDEKNATEEQKSQDKKDNAEEQEGTEEAEQTVKKGNLAFPVSQQPTPLVSFGQNILNKKQAQAQVSAIEFTGHHQYFINLVPSLMYGFTDNFSLTLSAPIAVRYRQGKYHSSGPGDAIIQFEYAFYTKAYRTYYDQATLLTNVTIPTGSTKKNPATGIGANSFFIGGTYSRMEVNWFYFTSYGGIITTSSHRTKYGNQFLYQAGFGRRICNTKDWLFDWMIEVIGTYSEKDKIQGSVDPDSGGNVVYLTPSLFISSSESLVFQLGLGCPIYQHLFGHQKKNDYFVELTTAWTF